MSCLGLYHVPSSLACHVYFMLYSIFFKDVFVFHLSFIFSFILHPSCILSLFISYLLSLLPLDSFVYSWQKVREYIGEYTGVFCHFYMTHVHILKGRYSTSCTFVGEENHRGDVYTKGEKTFLLCLFFYLFFMVLWYALLFSLHRVCVLDMHTSLCSCASLNACSDDHLLYYVIIVVIS